MSFINCARYILFTFNLVFTALGISVLVIGVLLQILYNQYTTFAHDKLAYFPTIIMVAGGAIFVVTSLGCCGTVRENVCMLSTFASLLLIIFIAEIIAAVGIFIFHDELKDIITESMDSSILHYDTDPNIAHSWDILQTDLQCCGINGTDDWKDKIPQSCCPDVRGREDCQRKDTYEHGCLNTIYMIFEQNSLLLAVIAATTAFFQLMGIGFACCLAHSIHKGYEAV